MKGGFYCPHCKTCNACSCETCKSFIQEGEYVNQWTEDGEALICGKCKQLYSPDQALEEEYQQRKTILNTHISEDSINAKPQSNN